MEQAADFFKALLSAPKPKSPRPNSGRGKPKTNMKKQITVSVDSFGRDYYSHTGRIGIEELVRDDDGEPLTTRPIEPCIPGNDEHPANTVPATLVSTGTTWSDQPHGTSGRYLTVEIDLPDRLAGKEIIACNWQHSGKPAKGHHGA